MLRMVIQQAMNGGNFQTITMAEFNCSAAKWPIAESAGRLLAQILGVECAVHRDTRWTAATTTRGKDYRPPAAVPTESEKSRYVRSHENGCCPQFMR